MGRSSGAKGGQAFDYLIMNESSFFAPFSFNQSHRKELIYSDFQSPFIIPPVQIRTCAANASGPCFESDAQTLPFGALCLNRSLILPASEFRTQEGKQNSSRITTHDSGTRRVVTALPSKRLSLSISCQLSWRTA